MLQEDIVKDEEGYKIVFAASRMTTARFLSSISKLLRKDGVASDAVSAYTQVKMTAAPRLPKLRTEERPEIWIRILPRQRQKSWDNIDDHAGILERNCCGHLLAGLLRGGQWEEVLYEIG